jgi:hypothetical protein
VARHNSNESEIPSLVGSNTSGSSEYSWRDKYLNIKKMGEGDNYTTSRSGIRSPREDDEDEDDMFYSQKMPAIPSCPTNEKAKALVYGGATTIEVSPGEFLRLRGAEETWRAIRVDFYMPCECICCSVTIFCIQDADYILCPACRVIGPMEGAFKTSDGGVGLGFTMRELAIWLGDVKLSNRSMKKVIL